MWVSMKVFVLTGLFLTALPAFGWACVNGVMLHRPSPHPAPVTMAQLTETGADARLVHAAEQAVADNQPIQALRLLDQSELVNLRYKKACLDIGTSEALESVRPDPRIITASESLRQRFERVVAVALMRAAPSRAAFSLYVLQAQLNKDRQAPYLRARIAEARAQLGQKEQAKGMLEALDRADLMPDTAARTLLASLRSPRPAAPAAATLHSARLAYAVAGKQVK